MAYCIDQIRKPGSDTTDGWPRRIQITPPGGGRYRQSGPRPDARLLRQPALEGLTRSARTDSPRQIWPEQFPANRRRRRRRRQAAHGGGGMRLRRGGGGFSARCWTWTGPTGPGPTEEHSVHPHHRDFIVTPIADQIEPIDSVSETEYYDLKNHFSEPQCKLCSSTPPLRRTSKAALVLLMASKEHLENAKNSRVRKY
ncbi:putative WRKY transcription factor 3 [Dorcoceras hygrometricum]|uniref:Putative WRKY transcription factor 3 n=1 Tax=Dorcoceras hygrometricum TaxID=472368 RepID=A0A2Z7D378_9LAMI|nr:putative WRKY transcription factor 3 [Dorcoceras hygrometricum]